MVKNLFSSHINPDLLKGNEALRSYSESLERSLEWYEIVRQSVQSDGIRRNLNDVFIYCENLIFHFLSAKFNSLNDLNESIQKAEIKGEIFDNPKAMVERKHEIKVFKDNVYEIYMYIHGKIIDEFIPEYVKSEYRNDEIRSFYTRVKYFIEREYGHYMKGKDGIDIIDTLNYDMVVDGEEALEYECNKKVIDYIFNIYFTDKNRDITYAVYNKVPYEELEKDYNMTTAAIIAVAKQGQWNISRRFNEISNYSEKRLDYITQNDIHHDIFEEGKIARDLNDIAHANKDDIVDLRDPVWSFDLYTNTGLIQKLKNNYPGELNPYAEFIPEGFADAFYNDLTEAEQYLIYFLYIVGDVVSPSSMKWDTAITNKVYSTLREESLSILSLKSFDPKYKKLDFKKIARYILNPASPAVQHVEGTVVVKEDKPKKKYRFKKDRLQRKAYYIFMREEISHAIEEIKKEKAEIERINGSRNHLLKSIDFDSIDWDYIINHTSFVDDMVKYADKYYLKWAEKYNNNKAFSINDFKEAFDNCISIREKQVIYLKYVRRFDRQKIAYYMGLPEVQINAKFSIALRTLMNVVSEKIMDKAEKEERRVPNG